MDLNDKVAPIAPLKQKKLRTVLFAARLQFVQEALDNLFTFPYRAVIHGFDHMELVCTQSQCK